MQARRIFLAGIAASILMGMMEMLYEALAGDGFWSPVIYIGATVLRGLQALQPPVSFDFLGVVVGLMGHMMNSVILTWLFVVTVGRLARTRSALIIWGMLWGVAVFLAMWYVVVPAIDPVMLNLNAPFFFLSHIVWGGAFGFLLPVPSAVTQTARIASA